MTWNLYENGKFLEPLCFSNGKTQKDIVKEVLDLIKKDEKIIFIHGMCGTGKSAIALNIANKLGKTSIVVPGKNLQSQYKRDYEDKKFLKKENGENLKISIITGRKNHKCKFLEDNEKLIPKIKKEINLKLHDIFEGKKEGKEIQEKDPSADNNELPCKIEIREKNWNKLREYLKKNPKINSNNFQKISDVKRISIASVCPYWSPVLPDKYDLKNLEGDKRTYKGLDNVNFIQYKRKPGCPYYEQFNSYIESDVIVFNSLKYKLETILNRKPLTEVEIIDECDEFLDSLSNERTINLERLQNSLLVALGSGEGKGEAIEEIFELIKHLKKDKRIQRAIESNQIIELRKTGIYDILKLFLTKNFLEEIDEESYLLEVFETAMIFSNFLEETYLTFSKKDNSLFIHLVTTNLAKKLEEFTKKNKKLVLMSGTLHSEEVLKNIFGITNFKIVEAETKEQGKINVVRTGLEFDCKYSNFSKNYTREDYLLALDKSIEKATKPILVHVNSFKDLPTNREKENFSIKNLISREDLIEMQSKDKTGRRVKDFKEGNLDLLFSTKDSRGIDFPGEECNSIVFTKYPNPNVEDPFWKILMNTKPNYYWMFYRDKAKRELLQKLYRGLRFFEDKVNVLSPDLRVIEFFERI